MTAQSAIGETGYRAKWRGLTTTQILYGILALVLLLQIELVFSKSINWDEFFHFSQIHQHLLGRPAPWLQAPFVALFSWVPSLPGDNITHIQIIRLLILPFELLTIAAIVGMASRFTSRETALLCGLIYATGGYVFLHAFALRADMIAAALAMTALWIGLCRPVRGLEIAAIALLLMLAFLSTIKTVLFAPAFLGVALFRMEKPAHRWATAGAAAAVLVAGFLLLWVAPTLPTSGMGGLLRDIGALGRNSVDRMFSGGIFPQGGWLLKQISMAPLLSAAVMLAALRACKAERSRMERILMLALLAPLATVAIYRNAFPYHFAFILPPAIVAVALAIGPIVRRYGHVPLGLLLLANALILSFAEDRDVLSRQRAIQTGLHMIFPRPVAYIDNSGMAGDFPRAINHFASGWGFADYYRAAEPSYSRAMEVEPVPLLLANNVVLQNIFLETPDDTRLLPEDEQIIRDNYVQHWGMVFVAGKVIPPGKKPVWIRVAVPGNYTIEGGDVEIDGTLQPVDSVVNLSRGPHVVAGHRPRGVTLRWGDHLVRPDFAWPDQSIYTAY